ncbi:unnamed protein product [Dracunculus medinensis]|uniref:Protein RFT1 homolog n=1 Tax=Dracunculus medinensis TaxID=318479 RepID=A0A0N4U3T0_DRAME|nr:unnamed protein product [Dracunculus medinensis]
MVDEKGMKCDQSLGSSLAHNISWQVFSRIISFLINMYLFRRVDGSLIGVVNIKPVLFPFVALILYYCLWFPFSATPPTSLVPSYSFALFCFGFSSWLESLAEPFIIVSLRLAMNAEYAFLQSLLTVLQRLLVLIFITSGVLSHIDAFCFAQDLSILGTLIVHSVFKQILTDGTAYVLTFTSYFTLSTKGAYDAVDKLGSLVARLIFAPLEHSAFLYFSSNIKRNVQLDEQDSKNVKKATEVLIGLLHLIVVIGMVISVFAAPYSYLAVAFYGGDLLVKNSGILRGSKKHVGQSSKECIIIEYGRIGGSEVLTPEFRSIDISALNFLGAGLLRLYCVYIVIIALNGITECFTMATMTTYQVLFLKYFNVFLNIYLQFAVVFSCWIYIVQYLHKGISVMTVLPTLSTIFLLLFSLLILTLSLLIFGSTGGIIHNGAHLAVGGALFFFVINHIYHQDISLAHFVNSYLYHLSTHNQ